MTHKPERVITTQRLITAYGDQAFYKAMELYDEAIKKSDLEEMRRLRRAVMELQERGYSRHPLRDKAPAAVDAIAAAAEEMHDAMDAMFPPELPLHLVEAMINASFAVMSAADKLARAAYEAGKRGEEWPG